MSVISVEFVEEVDNEPDYFNRHGELDQGDTWVNHRIYRLVNSAGADQFLRVDIVHDSYGNASEIGSIVLTEKTTKEVTVWA